MSDEYHRKEALYALAAVSWGVPSAPYYECNRDADEIPVEDRVILNWEGGNQYTIHNRAGYMKWYEDPNRTFGDKCACSECLKLNR